EVDGRRRTGLGASREDLAVSYGALFGARLRFRLREALHAERAFLHDPLGAHRHIGIQLLLERAGPGALGVVEPVEIAHLVGTIRGAIARAHAAVVNLGVQSVRSMVGGAHRADDLARCRLALLTHHRQELRTLLRKFLRGLRPFAPVALDSDPMHLLTPEEALLAH